MTSTDKGPQMIDVDLKNKITDLFTKIAPSNKPNFSAIMNQYDTMSTVDLKLKITELFSKVHPKNQNGFLNKMKRYDNISKALDQEGGNPAESIASDDSNSVLSFLSEEELDQIIEANKKFIDQEFEAEQQEVVENIALPESQTIYRDDEIFTDLIDYFKKEGKGAVFSNEDRLQLWIKDLMDLVKTTSHIEEDKIVSAKIVDSTYKPIVENYENGLGSGVEWLATISNEKKKVYNLGVNVETDQYHYSVESKDELDKENKIITADPKNADPATRFTGYDKQQERLYEIGKPYNNTEECANSTKKYKLQKDTEVYTISHFDGDEYVLDKRVLDDGVHRIRNVYESKTKKTTKEVKKEIAYGRKGITGTEDVEIVERETICPTGVVIRTKKEKRDGSLYPKSRIILTEEDKLYSKKLSKIIPFRSTNESYAVIEQICNTKDPLNLLLDSNPLSIDAKTIPVSKVLPGDKVILRFTYPSFNDFKMTPQETILPRFQRPDTTSIYYQQVPIPIHLLTRVVDKDVPEFDIVTNTYMYKDGTSSVQPNCRLYVQPMISHTSLLTPAWEMDRILIESPRIIQKFPCDCHNLSVDDTAIVSFTKLQEESYIGGSKIVSIPKKNPYFIGKVGSKNINYLGSGNRTVKIIIRQKDDENITFELMDLPSSKKNTITMNMEEFRTIYISKFDSSLQNIEDCIKTLEEVDDKLKQDESDRLSMISYKGETAQKEDSEEEKSTTSYKVDIWTKVLAAYENPNLKEAQYPNEPVYLLQILQSSNENTFGDIILVPKNKIKFELEKYVFEKDLLGDSTMLHWFNGVFLGESIEEIVPSIHEFMNKMTSQLRKRESFNNSFFKDLLELSLKYDKHQLPSDVKHIINHWIYWNLVHLVEKQALDLMKMKISYKTLYDLYESGNSLNVDKFRLINDIDEKALTNYEDWVVNLEERDFTDYPNKELVSLLTHTLQENTNTWEAFDLNELVSYQINRIQGQRNPTAKKWNKVQTVQTQTKIKELKVLDAIYTISDPVLRNKLLRDFIEDNCYLSEDPSSGQEWYYSKIDSTRTKLICPHVYLEITDKPLDKYSRQPEEGVVLCNNCGQVLNSLVFSYFEGYGENVSSREKVEIVNGKEIVGTMASDEIILHQEHVFDELNENNEYRLEVTLNEFSKRIQPAIFSYFSTDEGSVTKEEMIRLARVYIIDNNIADYNNWLNTNRKALEDALKKSGKDIKNEKHITAIFNNYLTNRTNSILIAILAILLEKRVPEMYRMEVDTVITHLINYLSNEKKYISAKVIDKETAKVKDDYNKLINYPALADFYKPVESVIPSEKEHLEYEEKFANYTIQNITDELTLYDAQRWLKYFIRTIHKSENIAPENREDDPCGGETKPNFTEESNTDMIKRLEEFIQKKLELVDNSGVKSRVQVEANKEYIIPNLELLDGYKYEARLISKNLFGSEDQKYIAQILSDLQKYRYIDYITAYRLDSNTGKIVPRLFENEIDQETKLSRTEFIKANLNNTTDKLESMVNNMRSKEITVEKPREIDEICEAKPIDTTAKETCIQKISDFLNNIFDDTTDEDTKMRSEITKAMEILSSIEKEYTIDSTGQKVYASIDTNETDPKKINETRVQIALREYEKLTKLFNYLRRDYNFVVNGVDLNVKKARIARKLGVKFNEGDEISVFETEYDYLIPLINNVGMDEFRSTLTPLTTKDLTMIEKIDCSKLSGQEYEQLDARNVTNKYVLCTTILRILLQYNYEWPSLKFNKPSVLNKIDYSVSDEDFTQGITRSYMVLLAKFVIGFIKNVHTLFNRQSRVLDNIQQYKQETFELVSLMERTRRMKFSQAVGTDLMKEFNKVMKGKRKLDVQEISSENPFETARVERQDRYNAESDGDYGRITGNIIQGETEDIGVEDVDRMED